MRPNLNQQEPQRSEDVSPSGACCTRCSSRRPSQFIGARRCRLIQERPELANMALCVRWARNHIGSVPDMGMRTLLRPSPGSALEQLRIPHRSSDIAKHLRGAAGATLHTDVESLRFLPPRRTITTERGDAASILPRMAAVRPDCHRIWPSVRPRLGLRGRGRSQRQFESSPRISCLPPQAAGYKGHRSGNAIVRSDQPHP